MADAPKQNAHPSQGTIPAEFAGLYSEEHIRRRREAMAENSGWEGADALDPKKPVGHVYGIAKSTRLTAQYRQIHRRDSMNITPSDVIEVLTAAKVKNWVLMGLHGYVGYLPDPRATQDVDVMVPYSERQCAEKAICQRWPDLLVRELSQVVRFLDPGDLDHHGDPKPVIDLMSPWGRFQETILKKYVIVDKETGHRIVTLEASLVAKYAAMVSSHRDWGKKEQDAVDFRKIVRTNYEAIDRDSLGVLADEVWEGGGEEIVAFLEIARQDKPFPI